MAAEAPDTYSRNRVIAVAIFGGVALVALGATFAIEYLRYLTNKQRCETLERIAPNQVINATVAADR